MTVNAVGKNCIEVDWAYLAGLIDGDGAIMATIEKHNEKKFRFRVRITIKVTQKSKKDILFLPRVFGCGSIRVNRTVHDWILRDQKQILQILGMLKKYSRMKQRQVRIAIKILQIRVECRDDLIKIAQLADTLSRYNTRSNNRRINYATMI